MIYILLTDGFEDIEALEVLDILRRAGLDAKTVGVFGKTAKSSHGVEIFADIEINQVKKESMSMLILPGGPGHTLYEKSEQAMELIRYAKENEIKISAICAAPAVIGRLGYLKGKRFTCYPGFECECEGGIFTDEKAVKDGTFITGKGPGAASEFAFMIVEDMLSREISEKVKKDMQY
ncbi:MAG: DJ-1/PfpI family protein [Ruminococcaceae bacterium]|nr:DJ-1/PfpI family protein [Oscillospiraceae bacterium]